MRLTGATIVKIILIAALCAVLCTSLAFCTTGIPFSTPIPDDDIADLQNTEPTSTYEFSTEEVGSIEIDWAAGAVDVHVADEGSSDGKVHVSEYMIGSAKQPPMRAESRNGTLSIDYASTFSLFNGCSFGTKMVVVELPADVAGSLDRFSLDGASGRYAFTGFACNDLKLHIASGQIIGDGLTAKDASLDLTSGSILLDVDIAEHLRTNITSGNVRVTCEDDSPRTCDLTVTSGDIEVNCSAGAPDSTDIDVTSGHVIFGIPEDSGFEARLDKTSGNFTCSLPCEFANDIYSAGDKSSTIDISLTSGNVELKGL